MPVFRVHIPYIEKAVGAADAQEHVISYVVEGDSWIDALTGGIRQFEDVAQQDFHGWLCQLRHDHVQVVDFETGRTFRLVQEGANVGGGSETPPTASPLTDACRRASAFGTLVRALDGDAEGAASRVLEAVATAVEADASSVLLVDAAAGSLCFVAATGPKAAELKGLRVPMSRGIAGFCARSGEAVAVEDAALTPLFDPDVAQRIGYVPGAVAAAPVRRGNAVLGAIEVLNPRGRRSFAQDDLTLLVAAGALLGSVRVPLSPTSAPGRARPVRSPTRRHRRR